jgi:hypothetical protein
MRKSFVVREDGINPKDSGPTKGELSQGGGSAVGFPRGGGGGSQLLHGVAPGALSGLRALPVFWIASKMLVGNRRKYVGTVLGITFAALLVEQRHSGTRASQTADAKR